MFFQQYYAFATYGSSEMMVKMQGTPMWIMSYVYNTVFSIYRV